jgi:hypothetical protein
LDAVHGSLLLRRQPVGKRQARFLPDLGRALGAEFDQLLPALAPRLGNLQTQPDIGLDKSSGVFEGWAMVFS